MSKHRLKIGDFVFVDSTSGSSSLKDWQGRGFGVVTAVESMDCDEDGNLLITLADKRPVRKSLVPICS